VTPDDLARIHAACFTRPRPWSAAEFEALLHDPSVFLLTQPDAFLLGRIVLDEAELLTLATAPAARRQGHARALLQRFTDTASQRGAICGFLEVASDNQPAQALYHGDGWLQAGVRPGYYAPGIDALILRKAL